MKALVELDRVAQLVLVQIYLNDYRVAGLINVGLFGLGSLFNGFIIRIEDIPDFLAWLPPTMLSYWAFVRKSCSASDPLELSIVLVCVSADRRRFRWHQHRPSPQAAAMVASKSLETRASAAG